MLQHPEEFLFFLSNDWNVAEQSLKQAVTHPLCVAEKAIV